MTTHKTNDYYYYNSFRKLRNSTYATYVVLLHHRPPGISFPHGDQHQEWFFFLINKTFIKLHIYLCDVLTKENTSRSKIHRVLSRTEKDINRVFAAGRKYSELIWKLASAGESSKPHVS
jgi:hypothetical protein